MCQERGTETAIAAIFYNEAEYLKEWIEFHLMVGVDRFYLYDNGSTDGSQSILGPYVRRGQVMLFPWAPFVKEGSAQLLAFAHAARNCGPTVRWLTFLDLDEFLFSETSDNIQPVLAKFENFAGIKIPRFEFGPNGHKEKPQGLVIDNYTRMKRRDSISTPTVKTAVQPTRTIAVKTHRCIVDGETLFIRPVGSTPLDLRINHYFSKSESEFEKKVRRGYSWHNNVQVTASKKYDFLKDIRDNDGGHYSMAHLVERLKTRM